MRLRPSVHDSVQLPLCIKGMVTLCAMWFTICIAASAQSITVSDEINIKNDDAYDIIGKYGDNILLLRDFETAIEVHAFDEELRQKWKRELILEKKNAVMHTLVADDTSFHMLYGYRQKGDFYLVHRQYDPQLTLIDSSTIMEISNLFFMPKFRNEVSEDRTKILIFRVDKESELHAGVYDLMSREVLWKKHIVFKTGSLRRDFRDVLVSNNGDMLLLMDHERTSYRNKEFIVMRVDAHSQSLKKKYIKLDNLYAFDMHAEYDNMHKRLWLSGLYNEKPLSKSLGFYTITLGLYEDTPVKRFYPFDPDLLEEVNGGKSNKKQGVQDFIVKEIIMRNDGGALILAELHKEYSRRSNAPIRADDFSRSGWRDYYFEDVIVFSVNPDGGEHWHTVLHKKQYSQDDNGVYSSFYTFRTPEKLRLLFNDEIRQNNTVSEYILRGNGYHKRKSVFSTDYQRLKLRFQDAVQVAYNECIVPSERSNRLNLVRITFDEGE